MIHWSHHIEKTCTKIRQHLRVISRISGNIDQLTAQTLVKAMVFPLFDYGDVTWSTCSISLQNRLQRLQNRAGKMVLKCPFRTLTTEVQRRLKWAPLKDIQNYHKVQMVQKCLCKLVPPYLWDTFTATGNIYRGTTTRAAQTNCLYIPNANNNSAQKMFKYRGACAWNALTPDLRSSNSDNFKAQFWSQYWNHAESQIQ